MKKTSNTFGKKLKHLRILKGLTQSQLAELAGVHDKHISKLEQGYYEPNYETLQKIAKALDLNIEEIDFKFSKVSENDNPFYIKSMQILNQATETELEFYYGLLKQAQRGIDILKN